MDLRSEAFRAGEGIPERYSREGDNLSPPLAWEGAPQGTREFAIICEDPDAPGLQPWVHWLVWGIPADSRSLLEGGPAPFKEGRNTGGKTGYTGPMPPPGHGKHNYHFRIYALDKSLDLEAGTDKERLLKAIEGHILDQTELIGTYERL
jgi:Raf kinase inhibitor-like YbhB/YbcL family protein